MIIHSKSGGQIYYATTLLYANRYTANTGSWGTEALIGNGNGSVFQPQIAIDGEGNAIAVWHQFDGTHGNIHANRFE